MFIIHQWAILQIHMKIGRSLWRKKFVKNMKGVSKMELSKEKFDKVEMGAKLLVIVSCIIGMVMFFVVESGKKGLSYTSATMMVMIAMPSLLVLMFVQNIGIQQGHIEAVTDSAKKMRRKWLAKHERDNDVNCHQCGRELEE